MKKYMPTIQKLLKFNLILLIEILILNTISYFTNVSESFITILIMIINLLNFIMLGFSYSKNKESKGYLQGIKIGLLELLFINILSLIIYGFYFNLSKLIYYIILLTGSIIGAIFGINKK